MDQTILCEVQSKDGQLVLFHDRLHIIRSQPRVSFKYAQGNKIIFLKYISAIHFCSPKISKPGFLQIEFSGRAENMIVSTYYQSSPNYDENTVIFESAQEAEFAKFRDVLEERISDLHTSS